MNDKIAARIFKLITGEDWDELQDLLLNTEDEWVLEMLEQQVYRVEGPQWVNGILSCLTCKSRESTNLRLKVYQAVQRLVRAEAGGGERSFKELVAVLMLRVDAFPSHVLVTLVDQYIEMVSSGHPLQGRWIDLMAKTITSVSRKKEVTLEGRKMTGEDYRYQVLKTLCDLHWPAETAISLLAIIKEMDLPKEELEDVLHKVEHVMKKVDYQSVPPLVYQLLMVAHRQLPGRVLQLVINYFNKQDLKVGSFQAQDDTTDSNTTDLIEDESNEHSKRAELTEAKGTVILHLTHHAQDNPEMVRNYLKHIRSSIWLPERLISPFNLALAFSLTSIERFQDQIVDSLKSSLLKYFREEEHAKHSQWLRDTWDCYCDVESAFKTTVENCGLGWDQVSHGVVLLAFSLLESGGGPKGESHASQRALQLAGLVLPLIIKRQPHLTQPVLSQLCNFIISSTSPGQYIVILEKLARVVPLALLEHYEILRKLLECMEPLSVGSATHLLLSMNRLLKLNMALKDALMIILRKMLTSRKVESRQIAVCGFLQFLKYFRVMGTLPSSQVSMTFSSSLSNTSINVHVHSAFSSSTNEALCLELLSLLRRCFSQQQEVKCTLYQGLYDVCVVNPRLLVSVMELLLQHCRTFMDLRPETLNPVQMKQVIQVQGEAVTLTEPLGYLLSALAACHAQYLNNKDQLEAADGETDDDTSATVLNEVCSIFDNLTEKLSGCDLGDMGINTNGDFSTVSAAGRKNLLSAQVMAAVFDSLLEHSFLTKKLSHETTATILSLFKSQQKIVELLNGKVHNPGKKGEGSKNKGGKGRPTGKTAVLYKSILSLKTTADILATTLAEEEEEEEGGGNNDSYNKVLGNNIAFQMYLLKIVDNHLSSFKGLTRPEKEKLLSPLKIAARVLLEECIGCVGAEESTDSREVTRVRQCLDNLATLISIFCKYFKPQLESVFKDLLGKTEASSFSVLQQKMAKRCQKMLLRILHHKEREPLLKDATTLVQMLSTITQAMEHSTPALREVQEWVLQVCKDQSFDNAPLTEALLKLCFQLSDQIKAKHTMTWEIARELHSKLGDIDPLTEVENSNKYSVVTEDAATTVVAVTLTHLDTALIQAELAIHKMKASLSTLVDYDLGKVEMCVISKFSAVISGIHEILQSSLLPGSSLDHTVTTVTKLYNSLSLYVKYYHDMYRIRNNAQLSEKFEKLVKMSGELVSVPVYPFITYIDKIYREASIGKENKKVAALTARAMKESRMIPSLIYAIEQYEKNLIILSRKCKVNLMHGMKNSTNRDFRIAYQTLVESLEEHGHQEEEATPASGVRDRRNSSQSGDEAEPVNSPPPPAASSSRNGVERENTAESRKRKAPSQNNGRTQTENKHTQQSVKKGKMSLKKR